MESKKYYKYVLVKGKERISTWIDIEGKQHCASLQAKILRYRSNRILSAPKGSAGIFLMEELILDEYWARRKVSCTIIPFKLEVYEAIPLKPIVFHKELIGSNFPTCMCVRVGKLVHKYS